MFFSVVVVVDGYQKVTAESSINFCGGIVEDVTYVDRCKYYVTLIRNEMSDRRRLRRLN